MSVDHLSPTAVSTMPFLEEAMSSIECAIRGLEEDLDLAHVWLLEKAIFSLMDAETALY